MMEFGVKTFAPTVETNGAVLKKLVERGLKRTSDKIRYDLRLITRTWENNPDFTVSIKNSGGSVVAKVSTDDFIFVILSKGTKPHVIRPKKSRFLVFQTGYTSKTVPNQLKSRQGGVHGDTIQVLEVLHPGHAPRNYTKQIAERARDKLQLEMNNALREWKQTTSRPSRRTR